MKNYLTKTPIKMRGLRVVLLVAILIVSGVLQVSASTYSETKKLSLRLKNASIESVLNQIEDQSEFRFVFNENEFDITRRVNVDVTDERVETILEDLLEDSGMNYKIIDRQIIIAKNVSAFNTTQQSNRVSGKVSDENGESIPGVSIIVDGTTIGVITDINGRYSIDLPEGKDVITFTFVGMKPQTITTDGRSVIDITMEAEVIGVDEVVVIGYTSTSRRNVASSISKITSDDIIGLSAADVRQTIQGKMAGVQVVNNSGDPGAGARIIIRGMGSFSNPDPLYVIDGIQGGDINSVASQDIESITVLKDAATTAIYGSAAANGVVIITTKSGKIGDVKVNYDGSIGMAQINKRYDMLNAPQYVDLVADIQAAGGLELTEKLKSPYVQETRTDWQEEIFRNAIVTDHNLRLSGGGENATYSFSAGYQNHESTVIDRNFQRVTLAAKLDEKLFNNRLKLGQHIRVKNDVNKGHLANFNDALRMPPYTPVYDETNLGGYGRADKVTDLNDANNPLNEVYNSDLENRRLNVNIELYAELDIYDGLRFKTQARLAGGNYHQYDWDYPSNGGNFARTSSSIAETYNWFYSALVENFFSYDKIFGDHSINATLGNSWSPSRIYRQVQVGGSDYTSDEIKNVALANSNAVNGAQVNSGKSRLSYFGRLGYTFREKYVLNASVRRDGSSVFGANNRWGTFYGLGAAWTISSEDFMANSSISNLKLRVSYGKTGNDNIPPFLTASSVWKGNSNNIVYSFGDGTNFSTGSIVNSVANPDLKWEETTQFDIGFDIGFLDNRLNFVVDYYNRNNDDLLIETQLPWTTGLGVPGGNATQWVNAASMKNSGFEFAVNYGDNSKEFKWDISFNTTYSVNEVTALGTAGDLPITKGEFVAGIGNTTRTDIGHPLASYYGYVVDHVAVDQAEVDALNAAAAEASGGEVTEYKVGLKPGDFIWKDVDGNGYIDDEDRTYIGNPSPTWQYGGIFNASFKNFDFQLQFHGIADVEVVNGGRYWWEGMSKPFNNTTNVLRRWRQEGDVTDIPAAGQNSGSNLTFSDWYVEKGDYLRVKNITLGYNLPGSIFNDTFSKFRIYVAVQNALTFTSYSGYDPEISTYDANNNDLIIFSRGIDRYQRPNPTMYRFGIQLNF